MKAEESAIVALLRACAKNKDLHGGFKLHADVLKRGLLEHNTYLVDALLGLYAKCGALAKAQELIESFPVRDIYSWTALITGYVQAGRAQDALACYEHMLYEGLSPDAVTFTCVLKACGSIGAVNKGEQFHDKISKQGLLKGNVVLGTALVDMYAKCGELAKARRVLEQSPLRNNVSWSAIIAGYAQKGQGEEALECFDRMQHEGHSPNAVTFTSILKACGSIGALEKGEKIHEEIAREGLLGKDVMLGNALVDMYVKCGALSKAQRALKKLPLQDVVSWNTLIAGYANEGQGQEAWDCYESMEQKGIFPDAVTFICLLKACSSIEAADKGEQICEEITRRGLLKGNIVLGTALVDMYAKCGSLAKAQVAFDELPMRNVISWSALIAGYVQHGQAEVALNCFDRMCQEGLFPNAATFTCILKACGSIGAAEKGKQIHDEVVKQGLLRNNIALGTALVDMYSKCGALSKAQEVLEEFHIGDVVSWSALIAGYAHQGLGEEALNCFDQMQRKGLCADAVTFTHILKACGSIGAADKGEQIHDDLTRRGLLGGNVVLGTALVDMYAKCGAFPKAQQVLDELPVGDTISWSALIAGYVQRGHNVEALNCFEEMQQKGLSPDAITFSSVLNACSHAGLMEKGQVFFENMSREFHIKPDSYHYTSMVDLFGHGGQLDKAICVLQKMPSCDCPAVWSALMGACGKWGDVNVARWAFENAVQVDEIDASPYVCMAKMYAAAGMREDAEFIEAMRVRNKAWKRSERSWWVGRSESALSCSGGA